MFSSAAPTLTVAVQGETVAYFCKLQHTVPFEGEATATLYGIPDVIPVAPVKFTKATTDLIFQIPTKADTPVSKYDNLFVQAVVPTPTGSLLQRCAFGGSVRVDAPPPPPKGAPPAPPTPPLPVAAAPAPVAPPRQLTRLEQLREKLAKTP